MEIHIRPKVDKTNNKNIADSMTIDHSKLYYKETVEKKKQYVTDSKYHHHHHHQWNGFGKPDRS